MITTKKLILISLFAFYLCKAQSGVSIYEALNLNGFFEIKNCHFLKRDYNRLYEKFDSFIDLMDHNEAEFSQIQKFEKDFLSIQAYKKRYCSAPPSYRNPRTHTQKRFNKIYFQFINEHYELSKEVITHPSISNFFSEMLNIDAMAKVVFAEILDLMEKDHPGITDLAYGQYKDLTVISKIVRYDKSNGWGTTPHCDKSALTLIWDSDDDNDESLVICQDMSNPKIKNLTLPHRDFSHQLDATSTLLISGSIWEKIGVTLKPTVHAVAPIKKQRRHAVISFLLIPDIDMSTIPTDFLE